MQLLAAKYLAPCCCICDSLILFNLICNMFLKKSRGWGGGVCRQNIWYRDSIKFEMQHDDHVLKKWNFDL